MTPLRQRMLDAMTVRGLAERTKECYTDAVARMARHYHRSPDLLSPPAPAASCLRPCWRASDIVHLRPPMARVPEAARVARAPRGHAPVCLLLASGLPNRVANHLCGRSAYLRSLRTARG
ncbi:phage integrase N-terminal SAM-like domain-containing protein [Candidatus Aalborgicola defluviihabitans]|uniref:phage integrase N-terminal SAM-like domain-containing protein n=1 Tax=Candidatus Aalborgicola defluviihabitans TaxID=3386187 RepID=UPI0039B930DA